jgi:DNA-binding MarR family transcriptional regulator
VSHPAAGLEETVHQRTRLGILAVLTESRRADFRYLRETLQLTDGNLSGHLQTLEQAGYVLIEKTFEGKRPRTWVSATRAGRAAFASELAALRALLERFDGKPKPTTRPRQDASTAPTTA